PRARLPAPATDDEVGRLAATLNGMLASLERARESERRFVADASHELRTPLTALRGNVDFLARHGATPELVDELATGAERLSRLADALLALSREEAGRSPDEEVQLDQPARAFARFWRGDAGAPGSGLGLAIVRATAERHGGRASVDGSRFTIELPALTDLSESGATTSGESHRKDSP